MGKRKNLKVFRTQQTLTQAEISKKLGCSRATYSAIENGKRAGRTAFWNNFQKAFCLPSAVMWELMTNEEA